MVDCGQLGYCCGSYDRPYCCTQYTEAQSEASLNATRPWTNCTAVLDTQVLEAAMARSPALPSPLDQKATGREFTFRFVLALLVVLCLV